MLNTIKKNWWIVFLGLTALVLITFLWPDYPEEQAPSPSPPPRETVVVEKTASTAPVVSNKQTEIDVVESPAPEKDKETFVDDVIFEEEEVPAKRNFVLCEYIVSGETQYEFTAQIRLINKGTKPIYGWSVNWEFEDGSTIVESSGVALGGNNPYTGQYLSSNAEIAPGKTVTFSFTGLKAGENGPKGVKVEGEFCM